ncbi:phage tail protein [Streptomyces sp. AV19]|uniref:phage tail protein n=1 Tax=Streptomyces sp. AV19 TaxID=2793068 RepID=UPI0018FEE91C|nr:phage tail protein [Streptomyces sp. AV19]MBH1939189.1 phage tail protein [Streptomyces sp. AV19]MDG4536919.1 phage tail protein [Streptomyces sp. AV19]
MTDSSEGAVADGTAKRGHRPGPFRTSEVPGYRSLLAILPTVYREGDFADRFVSGFDDVLAPVMETLDCLDGYFTAGTAPADFLDWMLEWSGAPLPASVPEAGRRYALRAGVRLQGLRGTRVGLELLIREVLGGQVDIEDSGGTRYGQWFGHDPADHQPPRVRVRVAVPSGMNTRDVHALVRDWLPAHVQAAVDMTELPVVA